MGVLTFKLCPTNIGDDTTKEDEKIKSSIDTKRAVVKDKVVDGRLVDDFGSKNRPNRPKVYLAVR